MRRQVYIVTMYVMMSWTTWQWAHTQSISDNGWATSIISLHRGLNGAPWKGRCTEPDKHFFPM